MKNVVKIMSIFFILFALLFSTNIYAASLSNVNVSLDKTSVTAGDNVTVSVSFGENLGSYTVDIAYDNNLFEYISATGGTANDNGQRVRVYYFDQAGGTNPRNSMSVTFKAKSSVTSSSPTNFSVTASGLANADASVTYDDITTAIVKNITIVPVATNTNTTENTTNNTANNTANFTPVNKVNNNTVTSSSTLPKTGDTVYSAVFTIIAVLGVAYIILKNKD